MIPLHDQVATPQGDVVVITKTRFYFFFKRPRTSVMPVGVSEFGRQLGFQARYNTCDAKILAEFHEFFVNCVAVGGFQPLLLGAKNGLIDFPPGLEHLRNYIIGSNA
jgi:hypothetical protein